MISKNEVKYIQSLTHQKGRNESLTFLAEGIKLVDELLQVCPGQIEKIYATKPYFNKLALEYSHVLTQEITEEELIRISQMQNPNQVLAIMKQFTFEKPDYDSKEWLIGLDGIQDPGNMGTIIRLADWFGIRHILCSMDCVDMYNTKVVQASMGSISRVGVHRTDLKEWMSQYRGNIIGGIIDGQSLNEFKFPDYGLLIIGSEGAGIRKDILENIKYRITIPSYGAAESLNAAMATGILLWELRRSVIR